MSILCSKSNDQKALHKIDICYSYVEFIYILLKINRLHKIVYICSSNANIHPLSKVLGSQG